ncbi:MAG: DNA cytosine methyltransferase [Nitrososphaerota archaeon]|nr:DNA cytosine methyltransferase [Candidatus Nezhaarchaeota archaeon]MDW8050258.1 DNA cytosine methyltransferase [Nitrososphaerota archaeon]
MYKVLDLFCGAGGFSLGFVLEGFKVMLGVDIEYKVAETYHENLGVEVLCEDIRDTHSLDLKGMIDDIDVIIASPPCEPFTGANPRREVNVLDRLYLNETGRLFLHAIRVIGDLKPKAFIIENVPSILESELKEFIEHELRVVGYDRVHFNVLYAEHYGTPSHRKRVFISNFKLRPKPIKKIVTVGEALAGLPDPTEINNVPNHVVRPIPLKKLKKVAKLRWGEELVLYKGAERRVLPNWVRLHPFKLAPTVLGGSRFIHPYENRLLTVREQARLMGFPDSFAFKGGLDLQYNMVGEAVPPPLSRAIAKETFKLLRRA